MTSNIIFIGGVHGVGKGYLCDNITLKLSNIKHLSSSEVLKWDDGKNKEVKNIKNNQDKLVINLFRIIEPDKKYILDGHFCLLKPNKIIEKIPFETFKEINPSLIILVTAKSEIIKKRLDYRDGINYDAMLLDKFQKQEIAYAKEVSVKLGIKFLCLSSNDSELAVEFIQKHENLI